MRFFLVCAVLLVFTGCATGQKGSHYTGRASWYGKYHHGRQTANGEIFDMNKLTAAHRSLPFGTRLRVRSLSTKKEVLVIINDRGPYARGRALDLSFAAAQKLGIVEKGEDEVEYRVLP
jgi:rare lipoprotein A